MRVLLSQKGKKQELLTEITLDDFRDVTLSKGSQILKPTVCDQLTQMSARGTAQVRKAKGGYPGPAQQTGFIIVT